MMEKSEILELLEQNKDRFCEYVREACYKLNDCLWLRNSDKGEIAIKIKENKVKQICKRLIYAGRFHNDCCLSIDYRGYSTNIYLRGTNRWGYDEAIYLNPRDVDIQFSEEEEKRREPKTSPLSKREVEDLNLPKKQEEANENTLSTEVRKNGKSLKKRCNLLQRFGLV